MSAHLISSLAYCRILASGFSLCPNLFHKLLLRIYEYWYVFIRIGLNYLFHFIHLLGVLCILYLISTGIIYGYVWWVDLTSMKYPYACFSLPVFVATLVTLMLFFCMRCVFWYVITNFPRETHNFVGYELMFFFIMICIFGISP